MSCAELDRPTLEAMITAGGPCAFFLSARWCGVCASTLPIWGEVAAEAGGLAVGKLDVDDWPEVAAALGLAEVPALVLARGGQVVFAEAGVLPAEALRAMLKELTRSGDSA